MRSRHEFLQNPTKKKTKSFDTSKRPVPNRIYLNLLDLNFLQKSRLFQDSSFLSCSSIRLVTSTSEQNSYLSNRRTINYRMKQTGMIADWSILTNQLIIESESLQIHLLFDMMKSRRPSASRMWEMNERDYWLKWHCRYIQMNRIILPIIIIDSGYLNGNEEMEILSRITEPI